MKQTYQITRDGDRRGQEPSPGEKLQHFIYKYWSRFYLDRPDLDRRKLADRRIRAVRTNF